jgi:hypothetical protein
MIEEEEDEDIQKMNVKTKLKHTSTHILESDEDVDSPELDIPSPKRSQKIDSKKEKRNRFSDIPERTGKRYERPRMPILREESVPTLHSNSFKYHGPSQKEEVMLAAMDAHLNELKEEEKLLPDLRKQWVESAADILTGVPSELPPFREVNHKITLIDENKRYNYHLPRCPDALKTQLTDKIRTYKAAGWWEERNVSQAAPMLCVYKKDGAKLRTVIA